MYCTARIEVFMHVYVCMYVYINIYTSKFLGLVVYTYLVVMQSCCARVKSWVGKKIVAHFLCFLLTEREEDKFVIVIVVVCREFVVCPRLVVMSYVREYLKYSQGLYWSVHEYGVAWRRGGR